jgi:hypothetical protein
VGNINALRVDLDKQLNGTWFNYEDGIRFKIARWGNEKFLAAQRAAVEQRKVVLNAKDLTDEQKLDANREAASSTILLDWENLDENGVPVAYCPEQALQYFRDPELIGLWTFVFLTSVNEANFRKERLEADLKNSPTS